MEKPREAQMAVCPESLTPRHSLVPPVIGSGDLHSFLPTGFNLDGIPCRDVDINGGPCLYLPEAGGGLHYGNHYANHYNRARKLNTGI